MFEDSRIADNVDLQVNSTWGRHCNHLLFVTNYRDMVRSELTLFVNNPDSESARQTLFRYLQQANVSRDTQWFLWSTVMSFVIVENLRYLVHNLNASEPAYLGPLWAGARIPRPSRHPQTFAFNRAALESIVKANCSGGDTMARCLRMAGVKVLDSRDDQGCARFLDAELTADKLPFRHALSPKLSGQCVSTTFVSVQTGVWLQGLLFEYLTHVLTPYGLRARLNVTDARIPWNASSMPNWNSSEVTRPSTSTTTTTSAMTTRPIKEIRQGSVESTFAPATFNKIQNLTLAEANSAALRRFSVAFNSTQKPSATNDGGRTRVRSSDAFNSTLESQLSPQ
ncbi:glycoprotein-N-acetylgalactosamine 3-beta-galactosyltransferase 1-like [Haemaphysalis longicornis]